jgi:Tfp pilus assembly protein PilO
MKLGNPEQKLTALGWWLHGLGLLIALAIGLLTKSLVLAPIDDRAAAHLRRADRLQERLRDADRIRAEHARLVEDLAAARRQSEELKKRIPDEPREADFLAQVTHLADEVGLRIQDYRPGTVSEKTSYSVLQVELIGEGDYASICSFLSRLPGLARHSIVRRLQIVSDNKQKGYLLSMSLQLCFAVQGQPDLNQKGS